VRFPNRGKRTHLGIAGVEDETAAAMTPASRTRQSNGRLLTNGTTVKEAAIIAVLIENTTRLQIRAEAAAEIKPIPADLASEARDRPDGCERVKPAPARHHSGVQDQAHAAEDLDPASDPRQPGADRPAVGVELAQPPPPECLALAFFLWPSL
jgi:hypothetical protein